VCTGIDRLRIGPKIPKNGRSTRRRAADRRPCGADESGLTLVEQSERVDGTDRCFSQMTLIRPAFEGADCSYAWRELEPSEQSALEEQIQQLPKQGCDGPDSSCRRECCVPAARQRGAELHLILTYRYVSRVLRSRFEILCLTPNGAS
jgi:hypothetical protein